MDLMGTNVERMTSGHYRHGKMVFVSGRFNVIHPGHLRLLRFAKELGGTLVVCVESDRSAGKAAFVPEQLRLDGVLSNSLVDEAFLADYPIEHVLRQLRPEIVVKGKEYEERYNPEAAVVNEYGGKLVFSSGEAIFSSFDLIRRSFTDLTYRDIYLPSEFMSRNGITSLVLRGLIDRFKSLRVLVIGDLIVDEYISCQALGMSQEDPTLVVRPLDSHSFLGGAGIVAAHAAGLGAQVDFISLSGNDEARDFAIERLDKARVNSHIFVDTCRPTTLKKRYRSNSKTLLRVSHLHHDGLSKDLQSSVIDLLAPMLPHLDLLVFSDFNYGALPQPLVDKIIAMARKSGILMVADSQSSSQHGYIGRFMGVNLVTPTEHEARISVRDHECGLAVLADKLRLQCGASTVLLKMGEEGLLVHSEGYGGKEDSSTDRIPALNRNAKDVSGAGDSLVITSAMTMACGGTDMQAALLGSLAAAIQVGRLGNSPLEVTELIRHFD